MNRQSRSPAFTPPGGEVSWRTEFHERVAEARSRQATGLGKSARGRERQLAVIKIQSTSSKPAQDSASCSPKRKPH